MPDPSLSATVWSVDAVVPQPVRVLNAGGFVDYDVYLDLRTREWDTVEDADLELTLVLVDAPNDVRYTGITLDWSSGSGQGSDVVLLPEFMNGQAAHVRIPATDGVRHHLEDNPDTQIQHRLRVSWDGNVPVQVFVGNVRLRVTAQSPVWTDVPVVLQSFPERCGPWPVGIGYASPRLTEPFALFLEQTVQTMHYVERVLWQADRDSGKLVDGAPAGEMTGSSGLRLVEVLRSAVGELQRWRSTLPW
jgi:hypothetical protein